MAVIAGGAAGATLLSDVSIDNHADRLISLRTHLGNVTSWTASPGTIVAIRDGAEAVEVDVQITGPVSGDCRLLASTGQTMASRRVVDTGDVLMRFRLTRNHAREAVLAAPPPP